MGEDYSSEFDSTRTTAAVAAFEAIMVLERHEQLSQTKKEEYRIDVLRKAKRASNWVLVVVVCVHSVNHRQVARAAGAPGRHVSFFGHKAYIIGDYSCSSYCTAIHLFPPVLAMSTHGSPQKDFIFH
jgi:uncharacterized protein with PIN domain